VTTPAHVISALARFAAGAVRGVALLAIHYPPAGLVLLAVLAGPVLFHKAMLGRGAQQRRRVRALRWRIRLRLHPGPGYASLTELWLRWGRLAALSHGRRARPGLSLSKRLFARTTDYAWRLGRAQYGRRVYARLEDQAVVLAPQRTGKSGLIADRILSHIGPVLATSTRPDLYRLTGTARGLAGPVDVWNPQGIEGVPSTFGWDILTPCQDLVMARRIAGWLASAVLGQGGNLGNIEWFSQKGDVALGCLLWAAAVSGRTITDVFNWAQLFGHEDALQVLAKHPDSSPQMLAVARHTFEGNRTAGSIRDTIELALAWTIIPDLAAAVTPAPGHGFDVGRFLEQDGTLYLIASGDEDSPLTPLFTAFASHVHYAAGLAGSNAGRGRLDPPLLMALDEVTTICPVALPGMLSDSAGKGVLIMPVAHSLSQFADRWGEHGAETIWATCGTKILLGGSSDSDMLEEASRLCGSVALGEDNDGQARVVPPELLRALPDWRALVLRLNLNPVVVKIRPAWKRRGLARLNRRAPAYVSPWSPQFFGLSGPDEIPAGDAPGPEEAPASVPEAAPSLASTGGESR